MCHFPQPASVWCLVDNSSLLQPTNNGSILTDQLNLADDSCNESTGKWMKEVWACVVPYVPCFVLLLRQWRWVWRMGFKERLKWNNETHCYKDRQVGRVLGTDMWWSASKTGTHLCEGGVNREWKQKHNSISDWSTGRSFWRREKWEMKKKRSPKEGKKSV